MMALIRALAGMSAKQRHHSLRTIEQTRGTSFARYVRNRTWAAMVGDGPDLKRQRRRHRRKALRTLHEPRTIRIDDLIGAAALIFGTPFIPSLIHLCANTI